MYASQYYRREGKNPINHPVEAVAFLIVPWQHRLGCELQQRNGAWKIARTHFTGPYDSASKTDYIPVTNNIASFLLAEGLVDGIPHWGYTSQRELRLNKKGQRWFFDAIGKEPNHE